MLRALHNIEAVSSTLLSWILACLPLLGFGVWFLDPLRRNEPIWMHVLLAGLVLWTLVSELWYITAHLDAYRNNPDQAPLEVAMKQPRLWWPLRPLASVWWVGHLGYSLAAVVLFAHMPLAHWLVVVLLVAVSAGLAYLSFTYMLVAVSALTKSEGLLRKLWKLRPWWSAAHAVAAIVVDYLVRSGQVD